MRVVFLKERADSSLISGPADRRAWGSNLEANTLLEVQKFENNFLITVECMCSITCWTLARCGVPWIVSFLLFGHI